MEGKDNIKELFSNKLGNYEAKVNPELWGKVASQIGTTATTVASTGMSLLTKVLIGLGISTAAITTVVILINTSNDNKKVAITSPVKREQPLTIPEVESNQPDSPELVDSNPIHSEGGTKATDQEQGTVTYEPSGPAPYGAPKPGLEDGIIAALPIRSVAGGISQNITNPSIVEGIELLATENPEAGLPDASSPAKPSYTIAQYTNVFSPNGDGIHDDFYLEIEGVDKFSIVIMNSDGKPVFKSNDTNFSWGGRDMTGTPVPNGQYVYILTGYDQDGNPVPEYRTLTVYR